jgi:hypothetical protein
MGAKRGVKLLWKYAKAPRKTRSKQERRQKSGRRSNQERKEPNRPPLKSTSNGRRQHVRHSGLKEMKKRMDVEEIGVQIQNIRKNKGDG